MSILSSTDLHIPIEIVEAILENIASDTDSDSMAPLYACSMASSELANCTRRHIFRKVRFDCMCCVNASTRCQRFLEIVAAKPDIPTYIKECQIHDFGASFKLVFLNDPLFPSVLDTLKNVQRFELKVNPSLAAHFAGSPLRFNWDSLEQDTKNAFHTFFSSAHIRNLHLEKIDHLPHEFANYMLGYKSVELDSCSFKPNPTVNLNSLSARTPRLEKLIVCGSDADPIFKALSLTRHGLKELVLSAPDFSWCPSPYNLSQIETLVFIMIESPGDSEIATVLSKVPEHNGISSIAIVVDFQGDWEGGNFFEGFYQAMNESQEVEEWNEIDTELVMNKFNGLKNVSVYTISIVKDARLVQLLATWFPRMYERGIIDIHSEYHNTVVA